MAKTPTARTAILPKTTKEALLEQFADYEGIDVIERRFKNPNDPGSLPILLNDEPKNCCMHSGHQRLIMDRRTTTCPGKRPDGRRCGLPVRTWAIYICDTTIQGRWAQMKTKGYVPVEVKDLQDPEDVTDLVKQTESTGKTYARRGDRGKEVVMKQPLVLYNVIKADQWAQINKNLQSKKALQAQLAESAGQEHGDEAGEMLHRGGITVESLNRPRTTLGEEADGD